MDNVFYLIDDLKEKSRKTPHAPVHELQVFDAIKLLAVETESNTLKLQNTVKLLAEQVVALEKRSTELSIRIEEVASLLNKAFDLANS